MGMYGPRFPRRRRTLAEMNAHPSMWHRFERSQFLKDEARENARQESFDQRRDELVERQEVER